MTNKDKFSSYQILIVVGLACLLFTVVLDYMLLPALSATLLAELQLSTEEFGLIASVYAISAGISALVASGYADRFDRRSFLLFFYSGFLIGLLLCAIAPSFEVLLAARIVTGIFGGVIAAICYAIVTDLFALDQRGRVMGFLQMAFAASLVAGLPLALYLSATYSWQLSYWLVLGIGSTALVLVILRMKPMTEHLSKASGSPWHHLYHSIANAKYWNVFSNSTLIVSGDVLFMTFNAAFMVNNLGVADDQLPLVYGAMGLTSLIAGPIFGRLADSYGKLPIFIVGTLVTAVSVIAYTHLGGGSVLTVVILHVTIFIGINARMVSSAALGTAIPKVEDRGSFMSIDASIQQLAGGLAAAGAGLLVFQAQDGQILNYRLIGWVAVGCMAVSVLLMARINSLVKKS